MREISMTDLMEMKDKALAGNCEAMHSITAVDLVEMYDKLLHKNISVDDIAVFFRLYADYKCGVEINDASVKEEFRKYFQKKNSKFDALQLAKEIGHDIEAGCAGCGCRC